MHPNDGRVVSNFIVQALRNEPITIYGDGSQTRAFCYVDDLIEGLMRLMNSPADFTGPVNLGNPNEFSIAELAQQIISLTNSRSPIHRKPLPVDDPQQRRPDTTLAETALNWRASTPLSDGLRHTIEYFDQLLSKKSQPPS